MDQLSSQRVCRNCQNKAFDSTFENISSIKKSIDANQEYLSALYTGNKLEIDLSKVDKANEDVMKALENNWKQKIAYQVGCTLNIVGEYEFCQEYKECNTCKEKFELDNPVKVCLPCAEI